VKLAEMVAAEYGGLSVWGRFGSFIVEITPRFLLHMVSLYAGFCVFTLNMELRLCTIMIGIYFGRITFIGAVRFRRPFRCSWWLDPTTRSKEKAAHQNCIFSLKL
jgi:hypothetical protein